MALAYMLTCIKAGYNALFNGCFSVTTPPKLTLKFIKFTDANNDNFFDDRHLRQA